MERFLRAKHWQIFVLTIGLPFILQIIITPISIMSGNPALFLKIMPIIMAVFVAVFFGWFWSIAIGLQSRVPSGVKMNVTKFKVFFFTPLVYLTIFSFFIVKYFFGWVESGDSSGGRVGLIMGMIVPLHLFCNVLHLLLPLLRC